MGGEPGGRETLAQDGHAPPPARSPPAPAPPSACRRAGPRGRRAGRQGPAAGRQQRRAAPSRPGGRPGRTAPPAARRARPNSSMVSRTCCSEEALLTRSICGRENRAAPGRRAAPRSASRPRRRRGRGCAGSGRCAASWLLCRARKPGLGLGPRLPGGLPGRPVGRHLDQVDVVVVPLQPAGGEGGGRAQIVDHERIGRLEQSRWRPCARSRRRGGARPSVSTSARRTPLSLDGALAGEQIPLRQGRAAGQREPRAPPTDATSQAGPLHGAGV